MTAADGARAQAENVQAALYRIAELASAAKDLREFYGAVHGVVGELMSARNFYIALYDEERRLINFPYWADEVDDDWPEAHEWIEFTDHQARGVTGYILRTGEAELLSYERHQELVERGEIEIVGVLTKDSSWLGAPLKAEGRTVGIIVVQSYTKDVQYTEQDRELLAYVGQHVGAALSRARAIEETRQRNAELALINSVQEALAGELELQAIYDVVGDKIRDIFDAQVVDIAVYDERTGLLHFPYSIERGIHYPEEPIKLIGFRKHVLEKRRTLLINKDLEATAKRFGNPLLSGEMPKSVVYVPLVSGGKATGVISLQNIDREHAFSESERRLLETLARSLSVALDNARLMHETRQRNAELALINSVQAALVGELELQSIYDLVGDRLQEVFDAQVVSISIYDEGNALVSFPYVIERGERLQVDSIPLIGFRKHVLETRRPLMINENAELEAERHGNPVLGGHMPKSVLFVPLVAGGKGTGVVSLQNVDREHAFTDADLSLLETLCGSLSVALENARLVQETRQRNAELALINSVQQAIAGELDPQAIYDLVGDRIQEVFDAQVVNIAIYDAGSGMLEMPYSIERGERENIDPFPLIGFRKHVMETGEPLMINENVAEEAERYGNPMVLAGQMPKSDLFVPLHVGGRATGVISLQNVDREHAFTESDKRLLVTLAGSLGVALDNARLVHETRQRVAELALINSVQDSIAGELDPQAIYDLVGEKLHGVFDAQAVDIAVHDEKAGLLRFVYQIERGAHFPNVTMPVIGFRKHVMETREPLAILENMQAAIAEYGNPQAVTGETSYGSAIFQPLVVGGRATGVISIHSLDREHAFSDSDRQLLATISGSLGVALDNAQLIHETRQRVAELATVTSVGQAVASQLELDALMGLVGERIGETFEADIVYVALHDEEASRIDFPYYSEAGERRFQEPMKYGEGFTSQILDSRAPMLLNRTDQFAEVKTARVGTPARSYLGVPILAGENAIGVISVQSMFEEGRFDDADAGLLATIAASVGAAIQNARLFQAQGRQKQYFESLVEVSPVAIVVMDADERVTGWNPAATELFGWSAEEAVGKLIDDLVFHDGDVEEGRVVTREALAKGRAQRIGRRSRKDGAIVDVELMLVPLTVDGEHVGFYAIYHDITELQRAREEAEAATQAKSAFLATMSHEIRTPMNAVIGMTDLLLGTELTDEQREFGEVVRSSGEALLHVIDDILDFSKIEAGKLELEREPFSLRECVEGALDIVAPRAWEKEIELGCLIDEQAPAGIVGDGARLRQVLLNLLSNAVKFTEKGEVMVLVDAQPAGKGKYRLELVVRDTGIGIRPDRMDRLFASFSQVDASTTRRYGGTGLGLAISKRLVDLMGGAISVESEEGSGSTFRIALTVKTAEVPAPIALDDGLPHLAGKRILIVDDNSTNREIVARHARSWGMQPTAVELPADALALIEAGEHFDVAVLDMMMPDMDGITLAREIRRHQPEDQLPLLLLTSAGRLPQARTGSDFSAQLAKPLKASQLYNALLRLLAGDAAEADAADASTDGKTAASSLRILLAEDNPMNQMVALRLLQRLGYGADVAANGVEALEALERKPYDVVLMDVQMPELDGLDASRQICERWPAESRPRIVAMTANALPEDREACFEAGMDDYVAKPIRAEELAQALKRVKPLRRTEPASANGNAFDAGALESLRELGGDEFVGEVIDAFLADAPALLAKLRPHDGVGLEELRRAAHTLKSNGATLGAEEFSSLCRELEQRAKSGRLDDASELVARIEREYRPLENALAALRSGSPA